MAELPAGAESAKADKEHRDGLLAWLATQSRRAGMWPRLSVIAGLAQTAAVIAQSAVLAWVLHAIVMEGRAGISLLPWLAVLAGAVALRALAAWAREMAGARASVLVRSGVRADLVDKVRELGPAWRRGEQGGAFSSLMLEQVDSLDAFVARYLPQRSLAMFAPLLVVAAVFPFSWVCALLLLATAPLIPLFMTLIGWNAQEAQTRQMRALSRMGGFFLDLVRGLTALRLMDAHTRQSGRLARVADEFRTRTMSVLRIAFLSSAVLEFFTTLAIALSATYLGFSLLGMLELNGGHTSLTLFAALFILFLAPEFYLPLRELGAHHHARAEALAAADRIRSLLAEAGPQPRGGNRSPPRTAPAIGFERLDFAYDPAAPVLQDFNLHLAAGECIALSAPSGGGKTTLLRLLLGQLRPGGGRIMVDGQNLDSLDLQAWREGVALMNQHPRLMAASLSDNLRIARMDATDPELRAALEFAGLDAWLSALPAGLDTRLGEAGQLMSGGQLRRLALARLWLRPGKLLLLDEPTASLDLASEQRVLAGLAEMRRGRTVILLSHRPEALVLADRVVRLAEGRVAE